MYTNPAITTAIAEQHRHDLITQARTCRLGRTARQGRSRRPARPVPTTTRMLTTAAAACAAATVFLLAPAGPAHASAVHFAGPTVASQAHFFSHRA